MKPFPVFVDYYTGTLRASLVGEAPPVIGVIFNTVLCCVVKIVKDGVCYALPNGTPVTMEVKRQGDYEGPAIALDITADVTGTGAERIYTLKAPLTGEDLNTALSGKANGLFDLQFFWGEPATETAGGSQPLAITIINTMVRDGDAIPLPLDSAGWEWLKLRMPEREGVVHNEETKTIEITAGAGADGDDGASVEMRNSGGYVQWRQVGAPTWMNLIALSAITGANGTNGSNGTNGTNGEDGEDGASVELQVSETHIQWRQVGAPTWTNLIALSALVGPPGADGEESGAGSKVFTFSGTLLGYTSDYVPGTPAAPPPALEITPTSAGCFFTTVIDGISQGWNCSTTDNGDGSVWIDTSAMAYPAEVRDAFITAFNTWAATNAPDYSATSSFDVAIITTAVGGSSKSASASFSTGGFSTGGGNGSDEVPETPPGGAVSNILIQEGVSGKKPRILQAWAGATPAGSVNVEFGYLSGDFYPMVATPTNTELPTKAAPTSATLANFFDSNGSSQLRVRLVEGDAALGLFGNLPVFCQYTLDD